MLPKEQIPEIKKQLIKQIEDSNLPNSKEIKNSILGMDGQQLEEFLIQNNLIKENPPEEKENIPPKQQCIFCSIVSKKTASYIIDENKSSVAALEINPISTAHVLIIPKEHLPSSEKIPQTSFSLAKKIAKKIKTRLKPKDVIIASSNLFGHEIINVIPVYKNETPDSPRKQASKEELEKLQKRLEKKTKPKKMKKAPLKELTEERLWLPRRIP